MSTKRRQVFAPHAAQSPQVPKFNRDPAQADARDTAGMWWSRRLASGSDWMEEWMGKPIRK